MLELDEGDSVAYGPQLVRRLERMDGHLEELTISSEFAGACDDKSPMLRINSLKKLNFNVEIRCE